MIKILFKFLQNPYSSFGKDQRETVTEKLDFVKRAILFCIGSAFVALILVVFLIEMPIKSLLNISIFANLSHNRHAFRESVGPTRAVLDICLAAPFFEEGAFRFILIAKSRCLQIISLLLMLDAITSFHSFFISSLQYYIVVMPVLFMLFFYNLFLIKTGEQVLQRGFYNFTCWFSIISFGLVHIGNFTPINGSLIFLYPFYVLPQLIYGVVLSYAAINYKSIILPFLIHAGINSLMEVLKVLTGN
ncbi:type II CAAX prenyl endopeptidase Rce1 family protein [Dyadobacter sp. CY356]|uniref:CPBP family glutamic-type intramembrane protease n=1 Tax=Dyadobacter sp. CY356 TaxID=2906442 RepID=UPI001F397C17|nr:CPBP family glutamic-type intramembrane protease [Dyadobacter sp. CY356]MCF0054152.1 CPBP family glutamic-type intramembrane protease [Dyadobacter sp. CY356]